MIDTNRIIGEFADLNLKEANEFMQKMKAELEVINKNTFVDRIRNYFLDNPNCKWLVLNSYSNASDDGMYYGIAVSIENDNDDELSELLLQDIDTEIFEMYEGMEVENRCIQYNRDFNGFDNYILDPETDEEDEDQE